VADDDIESTLAGFDLAARRREERRAVEEGGGGESEGFELAERELIEHASHADDHSTQPILRDAGAAEEPTPTDYAEPDTESKPD